MMLLCFMIRRPPRHTITDACVTYLTLFRSFAKFVLVEGFALEQRRRAPVEDAPVALENGERAVEDAVDDPPHGLVDAACGLFAVAAFGVALGYRLAEEARSVPIIGDVAQRLVHADRKSTRLNSSH